MTQVVHLLTAALVASFVLIGIKALTVEEAFRAIKGADRTILATTFSQYQQQSLTRPREDCLLVFGVVDVVPWGSGRVILAIVATFGLGAAMDGTGVAAFIANGLVKASMHLGTCGVSVRMIAHC